MSEVTPFRPRRVLIADDCHDTAGSLALLLELWGYETLLAYDGRTALKTALSLRPDLLLLDIDLPLLSGHDVARRIRAEPGMRGTLLWALTGHGLGTDHLRSRDASFDRHLVKPFDLDQLRRLLAGVVGELACAGVGVTGTANTGAGPPPARGAGERTTCR